ncbi:thioredoxin family protein [Lutibacter holmesii]|uniref:Thioredoxin family protein n=1 Tax=Lutibacter holmesii TaxID=1137985 RepID=A0ABW3WR74_9FLAO
MKKILLSILVVLTVSCVAQTKKETATLDKSGNLVGIATKENFLTEPFKEDWFDVGYNDYKPNQDILNSLKPLLQKVTIKAFMGTWCGDSQEQTPILYNILDATNFNYQNLEMICVNRSKKTPDNLQKGLDIERVPTFIFYKDGEEIGRFVEYPRESVEADILAIVNGKPYKHSYQE